MRAVPTAVRPAPAPTVAPSVAAAALTAAATPATALAPAESTSTQASDLWRLVTDPDAVTSTVAAAEPTPRGSRMTTAFLTVLVALVVIALVAGFLVMFTNLL